MSTDFEQKETKGTEKGKAGIIRAAMGKYCFEFQDEREFQEQFARMLRAEGIPFKREHSLSAADRPDFMIESAAIDLKIGGPINGHLRQLKRYANHAIVSETILISTRPFVVPSELSGKPLSCLMARRRMF